MVKEPKRGVRKSKQQSRKRRLQRMAERVAKRSEFDRIFSSVQHELLSSCGFSLRRQDMRLREPPTRSVVFVSGADACRRLNRTNRWHIEGDIGEPVKPVDTAVWLWWNIQDEDDQQELYELSRKCGDKGKAGVCHEDPDPMKMLADMAEATDVSPTEKRYVAMEGENAKQWGRK